jgi:hypothetical protein
MIAAVVVLTGFLILIGAVYGASRISDADDQSSDKWQGGGL